MNFLNVEEVLHIHDRIIEKYGGLLGVRDMGLLMSAIEMPKAMMFGEFLHASIYDKAAAYLFHIVCNRAFLDGNKRTGAAVALTFLKANEIAKKYNLSEFEEMVCKVAQSQLSKKEISEYLENKYEPIT